MIQVENAIEGQELPDHQLRLISALSKLGHRGLERILDVREQAIVEEVAETFFAFPIGAHHFVVNAHSSCEVFVDMQVAALPNSPACLLGLCNVRGLLLPVYQLHLFLAETPAKRTAIFCIGKGEKAVGLLIDALPISLPLRPSQRQRENVDIPLLKEISDTDYHSDDIDWHMLDGSRLGERLLSLSVREQDYLPQRQMKSVFG